MVGLPKNQHGDDSKKAGDVRAFINRLLETHDIETEFVDERFSTVAVEKHLIHMDVSRKQRKKWWIPKRQCSYCKGSWIVRELA